MAFRQCPKRLWLELHKPELRDESSAQAAFASGNAVGEIARQILDPHGDGVNLDPNAIGWDASLAQTQQEIATGERALFEAYFQTPTALALADVMLPAPAFDFGEAQWEMIEVKGSTSVKAPHLDDIAIQAYVARESGVRLSKVSLAHIDNSFVYQGGGNYDGLLTVVDLTTEALNRQEEVARWLAAAQVIAESPEMPKVPLGPHCQTPYPCLFCHYCQAGIEAKEDPLAVLPHLRAERRNRWEANGIATLESIPDGELSFLQERVRTSTLTGQTYFDAETAAATLAEHGMPARFLDFETVQFSVPQWIGTRPYQGLPFQYSLHHIEEDGSMQHREFLDLSGNDPRHALAVQLIKDCGDQGPVFVYNASFEMGIIQGFAAAFPALAPVLEQLLQRIVDLHPIVKDCYYHPSQCGSWSLKAVTPAIAPELSYAELEGIQSGNDAGPAYLEAINPETKPERRETLRQQMLAYCKLDTLATVKIWECFKKSNLQSPTK